MTLLSTRVQMLARRLGRSETLPPEARADLAGVVADAQALGVILDDLLVAAEQGVLGRREPCDLAELVTDCVAAGRAGAEEKGVRLSGGQGRPGRRGRLRGRRCAVR